MTLERSGNPEKNLEYYNLPAIESFSNRELALLSWSDKIANNENFQEEIKERQKLKADINDVFDHLPTQTMPIEIAVEQGFVEEEEIERTYRSLSQILNSEDYKRLILYLPFELLPDLKWKPKSEMLQQAAELFRQSYMRAWRNLLYVYDVRANFIDGDVLEVSERHGDLPRVVKVAHFLPILVEKGFISPHEIKQLTEDTDELILKQSIADVLPVLLDLNLLPEKEIEMLKQSNDPLIREAVVPAPEIEAPEEDSTAISFTAIEENLHQQFSLIENSDYGKITPKRKAWLVQKKKSEVVESIGDKISQAIIDSSLTNDELVHFLSSGDDPFIQQTLIEGIRKAIESTTATDQSKAQEIYTRYKDNLLSIWQGDDVANREAVTKAFRRLKEIGIVKQEELDSLGIKTPKLAGPFSQNIELIKEDANLIDGAAREIESDPELSKLVYPVALIFGSKVKGYGEEGSDIDLAVFVKPGTALGEQDKLESLLFKKFKHEKVGKEIIQFWLDENGDDLVVHDFGPESPLAGESTWTHILFGAVWKGQEWAIKELRQKLLEPYLFENEKLRRIHLEELERDTLQYRLMHKGYEKFYPPAGGLQSPHSDLIDTQSAFWDSGYRQLATKLFLSRVFLPKISQN